MPSTNSSSDRRKLPTALTKRKVWIFILLTIFILVLFGIFFSPLFEDSSVVDEASETLILVSVLFRHGDRTPTDFYPTDPYGNVEYWPEGLGTLTNKGKREAYDFGQWLRRRYKRLIPDLYFPDNLYVMSSDHDRCLMSAQLCLAGLYPPRSIQIWNENLLWQPIPIHTTPRNLDQLIVMKKPCPNYDSEFQKVKKEQIVSESEAKLFYYLTNTTGKQIQDINAAELLFNTLEIEEERGLLLPSWTSLVYPQPLADIAARSLALFTETSLLKKLKGGPLVREFILRMKEKEVTNSSKKMFLYSGHDLTLVSVMRTLGYDTLIKAPDPLAALLIEFHTASDGQYYVQIFYRENAKSTNLQKIDLPTCNFSCTFGNFTNGFKDIVSMNWTNACLV